MASVASISVSVLARVGSFVKGMGRARRAQKDFSRSSNRASRTTKAFNVNLRSLGRIAGAAALGRGLVALATKTEMFNRAMRNSLAIMGDVSDAMRNRMAAEAIRTAGVTRFSSTEIAKSFFFLASAGLTAAQSVEAVGQVAEFAQAGMFDMARATSLLADAQSALGLRTKDPIKNLKELKRVADVLTKANTLANANVEQFSEALTTKAAAAARIVGIEIEEVVAVLASFAAQGLKSSEAGTAFNIVLRELTTKANKFSAEFKAANIAVFDTTGNMRNMADIIEDLERRFDGASARLKKLDLIQLGFNDKSIVFLQTLIGQSKAIREYESALSDAADTTKNVADKQLTDLQKQFAKIDATIQSLSNQTMPTFIAALQIALETADRLLKLPSLAAATAGGEFDFKVRRLTPAEIAANNARKNADAIKDASDNVRDALDPDILEAMSDFEKIVDKLDKSLARLGFSQLENTMADLQDSFRNAGDALSLIDMNAAIDLARQLARETEALEAFTRKEARAFEDLQGVFEQTRTPLERYNAEVAKLNELVSGRTLKGRDTFARRMQQLNDELERSLGIQTRFRSGSVASFRETSLDRVIISTAGKPLAKSSPQRVHDPQLQTTNRILRQISNTGFTVP